MQKMKLFVLSISILALFLSSTENISAQKKAKIDHNTFGAIQARHIGPATMSGRISAIDALQSDPRIVYVGSAGGGVWKSKNAGVTFKPVFDKYTQSIGAVRIDQNHPDTVWVGTGEPWTRNSVSVGNGVFVSYDGGDTWKEKGLENTERISRIVLNPENSNIVYVAALGHLWNANEERGVFKSIDGGNTWKKVLYVDDNTGCSDITINPKNPNILYAGMWDFRRYPYSFNSGGPGSGLYKSEDGGETWKKITKDLPKTTLGRIAVSISPVYPERVYALIESEKSALYRSDDNGESWVETNTSGTVSERPFYFSYIYADPVDSNKVWKPGFVLMYSKDAGEKFISPSVEGGRYHVDTHAYWISEENTNFMYLGTDGGVYKSNDLGSTWTMCRNLPVSQFYHVSVDNEIPYNVYGGLQDNGSWMGPSESPGGIGVNDWDNLGGGDGFYVYRDKLDETIYYTQYQGGNISRFHSKTKESKAIKPYKDKASEDLRFHWNTPVYFSKDGERLYVGAQYLYRSMDKGDSWERISEDLTTDDPEKQKQLESGGLTIDNSTAENHCTIYAISESPLDKNIIWAGTDDGNLQISPDGGKTWNNVTANVIGLPANTWVSSISASNFNKDAVYATFDGHRHGDKNAYVYYSKDLGKTWTALADKNIASYCHFVVEDPESENLVFLGTEMGLYVSIDKGAVWSQFKGNIPNVAIREIVIKDNDVVLATHGRGILIIDDITPLRQLNSEIVQNDLVFLNSRPYIIKNMGFEQRYGGDDEFVGSNPMGAAYITYYLKKRHIFGDMFVEVFDKNGELVKTLPSGKRKGINRIAWQTRKKAPKVPPAKSLAGGAIFGPSYEPGDYTIKITKGDEIFEGKITIMYDPDSPHSKADRDLQFKSVMQAYNMLEDLTFVDKQITNLIADLDKIKEEKKLKGSNLKKVDSFYTYLENLHKSLVSTRKGDITGESQLREKMSDLYGSIIQYDGKPTASQIEGLTILKADFTSKKAEFDKILKSNFAKVNSVISKAGASELKVLSKEEYDKENE